MYYGVYEYISLTKEHFFSHISKQSKRFLQFAYHTTDFKMSLQCASNAAPKGLFLTAILSCIIVSTGYVTPQANRYPERIKPSSLDLGPMIGNGAFGEVRWGWLYDNEGEKNEDGSSMGQLVVTKSAKTEVQNAADYLNTEACLNRRLRVRDKGLDNQHHPNIAPYLGECTKGFTRLLVWRASGNYTIEDLLTKNEPEETLSVLGKALGVPDLDNHHQMHVLGRKVLQQLLSALSYCHAKGIVHRDIKPANILVDESTKSLHLIDFGSAADMASLINRRGYRGAYKGVRNLLYCAPEEFVKEDHPYAFDVYSVAACWLRIMIPGLRTSEDSFFDFRTDVKDCKHDLEGWRDACFKGVRGQPTNGKDMIMPTGWKEFFHSSSEGRAAFELVNQMMQYRPSQRPSASEILSQQYLNPLCTGPKRPLPPPRPFQFLRKPAPEQSQNCEIPEWFYDEVLDWYNEEDVTSMDFFS